MNYDPIQPNSMAMVKVLAEHYKEHPSIIVAWLRQFDAKRVTEQIAKEIGA